MPNSIQDYLLGDRIMIAPVSDAFVENIKLRLKAGIPSFDLETANIESIYCSSINKHTCEKKVSICPEKQYIIFDEHHIQLLYSMNLLFYMYGQNDIKFPILSMIMDETLITPKKRLNTVAAILLAEKSLLEAIPTRALLYLTTLDENKITEEDFRGEAGRFDLNWFLLKERRTMVSHAYVMNFYVYHELAHIKARQGPLPFLLYSTSVSFVYSSVKENVPSFSGASLVPIEEIACDVYALDLLFDYVMAGTGDYDYEFMVESYIIAITNLTIMDSISAISSLGDRYINSWLRIIVAIKTLSFLREILHNDSDFGDALHRCMKYCYMKYKNYLEIIQGALLNLEEKYGNVSEKHPPFSKEWEEEKNTAIHVLASIK